MEVFVTTLQFKHTYRICCCCCCYYYYYHNHYSFYDYYNTIEWL